MNILVTAGNTQTPIDRVRCLTNIFSGRTGARIALEANRRGHAVTLLTSHPEVLPDLAGDRSPASERWRVRHYRTFDDLSGLMESLIPTGGWDAIVHSAAVSDYALDGVYSAGPSGPLVDALAGKIKSHHAELWLRLVPTPKLVDRIRDPWGFNGCLVKFKLEVDISETELEKVAERSRIQSRADLMVANTLEGMNDWALLGPSGGHYQRVNRDELAVRTLEAIENHA